MLISRYRFLRHRCNRLLRLKSVAKKDAKSWEKNSMEPFNPSVSYMYSHQSCFPASYQPLFMQQQLAHFRYANFSPSSLRSLTHPAFMHYPNFPAGSEQIKTISEHSSFIDTTDHSASRSFDSCHSLEDSQNEDPSLEDDQSDPANSGIKSSQIFKIVML